MHTTRARKHKTVITAGKRFYRVKAANSLSLSGARVAENSPHQQFFQRCQKDDIQPVHSDKRGIARRYREY